MLSSTETYTAQKVSESPFSGHYGWDTVKTPIYTCATEGVCSLLDDSAEDQ